MLDSIVINIFHNTDNSNTNENITLSEPCPNIPWVLCLMFYKINIYPQMLTRLIKAGFRFH